ncbi:MAG: DUF1015 family protein [Nitriliruptoraceae bacterium]
MLELHTITPHLVAPEHAARVIAPAYDALTAQQREALAATSPDSFLQVLPSGRVDTPTLQGNRRAVARLLREGRFTGRWSEMLVVLELTDHGRQLTAVVGDVDVAAYLDGTIRPHEHVRPERVAELSRYLDEVGYASSPVCVLHTRSAEVEHLTRTVRLATPLVDASLPDGGTVRLWPVTDPARRAELAVAARSLGAPTIADGHHRAAAVAHRVGDAATRAPAPGTPHRSSSEPPPPARRVLTALVAGEELAVEPFHRRIDGLGDVTADEVAAVLAERGLRLEPLPGPSAPERHGTVHLVVAGSWWRLEVGDRGRPQPGGSLDAAIVEREVLAPLGTLAPGPEPAPVTPVPGPVGLDALDRPGAVGIALLPATLAELLAVTGAGHVLPQKSTYLFPKLRSGVLLVPR